MLASLSSHRPTAVAFISHPTPRPSCELRPERKQLLEEAIEAVLEPTEQEAVRLRYIQFRSQDDITRLLELDGTGARGLLQRCRRKLSRELSRRLEDLGHGTSLFLSRVMED